MSWGRAKRAADMIPAVVISRLKTSTTAAPNVCASWLKNNPLGDYLRFAALIAHAQEVVLYDHPLEMDLTVLKKRTAEGRSRRWISTCCFA